MACLGSLRGEFTCQPSHGICTLSTDKNSSNPVFQRVPARYVLCLMFFLGLMVTFLLRVNINLAIVGMVNTTSLEQSNVSTQQAVPTVQGEFAWDEVEQSVILSSFFWGYLLFQVPGGRVAEVVGAKRVFGGAVVINGILSLVLPFFTRIHWILLLVIRALQGLSQGVMFPALSASVIRWVPLSERARFMSFAVQGASLGTVVAMPLCGLVLNTWGWESVFYVSGVLALIWAAAWSVLMFDTPDLHPRISREERQYLKENLKEQHSDKSSWLTSLPYLCQWIFANLYGTVVDILLKKNKMSLLGVRRMSIIISHLFPAMSLLALSLAGDNTTMAVAIMTIAVTTLGAYSSGYYQNPMDIAPNFAGSLTGLMNAMGSVTGVISTPIAGAILQKDNTTDGWSIIFWISATMYTVCSLPYIICFKAEVQPWNDVDEDTKTAPVLVMSNVVSSEAEDGDVTQGLTKAEQG
ncbi:sialin-like isoform X3 [Periplaneta americana]|uniref:sialin-like isoform X3 n=1 Tax=Periplaneta americana TaxID=6978 RepID=UPI0037E7F2D9